MGNGCEETADIEKHFVDEIVGSLKEGRFDVAAKSAMDFLSIHGENANIRYLLGLSLFRISDFRTSNLILRRLNVALPLDANVHVLMARNFLGMKEPVHAVASLQRALKINGAMQDARNLLNEAIEQAGGHEALSYSEPLDCQIPGLGEIYKGIFGYRNSGRFLEVGAFDGESFSNTSFLADLGWSGVYVEPIPRYAEVCRNRHVLNDVRVLEYAVGGAEGKACIEVRGVLSSLSTQYNDALLDSDKERGLDDVQKIDVQVITPDILLDKVGWSSLDLMVVDVEGYEWPIISNFDFARVKPKVIIMEVHDADDYLIEEVRVQSKACVRRIEESGYRIHWRDSGNVIFAAC